MWIYGPNRKEKFETLPSFARYPARFPSFKIAGPTLYFYMAKKNFFKVCLVGTLNLCLNMPKKKQKTRNESDHSRLILLPKTAKKIAKLEFV